MTHNSDKHLIKALMALIIGILFIFSSAYASADDLKILLVLSSDAEPYQQTKKSFTERLSKEPFHIESILLDDLIKDYDRKAESINTFVAVGTKAAVWLHEKVKSPAKLIYCMVSDLDNDLTDNSKSYGISTDVPLSVQFDLIREALPKAKSIGILYQSDSGKGRRLLESVKAAIPSSWRVEAIAINQYESIAKAIDAMMASNIDIIWTSPDPAIYDVGTTRSLLLAAMRNNKPVFGFSPACVRAGALIGVGIEPSKQGIQAADILIASTKSKDLSPAEAKPSPKYEIAVNLIVANKLSIDIPDPIIKRSTYVFEAKK